MHRIIGLSRPRLIQNLLLPAVAGLLTAFACAAYAESTDYSPVKLRGYGTLAGTLTTTWVDGEAGATLKIACDNPEKAGLVQAKFLSDLQSLPGVKQVTLAIPGQAGPAPACEAEGQGVVAAARVGAMVDLFSAPSVKALTKLIEGSRGAIPLVFTSDAKVPMALDRFDRYGFQSYYHPYQTAQARTKTNKAVPSQIGDFKFAQQENHIGLVVSYEPDPAETAEGVFTGNAADWLMDEAQKYELPIAINLDVYKTFALLNRYPEQLIQYQPQFLGGEYGSMNFGEEILSWNAFQAKDVALGELNKAIRPLAKQPNITDWLEGHSEMHHGIADYMLEYGPVADEGYRTFLKSKYGTVDAVAQRWHGNASALKSWDDVHVPELYSFLGWGPDAIDLTGTWSVGYDAAFDSSSAARDLDDSGWPKVPAPGHAIVRFLPRKPAVFRRHIAVDAAWRTAHDRVWLYVWDFNDTRPKADDPKSNVRVYVNGTLIPEIPARRNESHWAALEVSKELIEGDNLIAITLPKGMFNGRVYLAAHEPIRYPNLGPLMNAQWADFADWNMWLREKAIYRGCEAIRQADPISGIKLAAPGDYSDGIDKAGKAYGGDLHDTGSMAGFWNEYLTALMRGAGLPMSAEPGGPAQTPLELQAYFGRWLTEGVNQIDYFQELGDLNWYPDIRQCFDENRNIFTSVGKYHPPVAQVAELCTNRDAYLVAFPWNDDDHPGSNPDDLGSGYWAWNIRGMLRNYFETDAVSESSFERGDAARYRVILDSNTTIMDEKQVADIEKYVSDGGTFVTFVQTGRHTSTLKDAWPIERLTGYHVTSLDQRRPWRTGMIEWAKGQNILSGDWADDAKADGLSMKKVAADTEDLAYWKDGSVAIGMRPLGKGMIIEIGCRFTKGGLPQRLDYGLWDWYNGHSNLADYGFPATTDDGLLTTELKATRELFTRILKWRGVEEMPVQLEPADGHLMMRHDISNSGLYDVWTVWNDSTTDSVSGSLNLRSRIHPEWRIDLKDGSRAPIADHRIGFKLAPCQTAIYLTPRNAMAMVPAEWFNLQRNWWQGTADLGKPFPSEPAKLTVDLTNDWAFQPLDPKADAIPMAGPQFDDSHWKRMNLGIFSLPDYPDAKRGIFRKKFSVPAGWNAGRVLLSIQCWNGSTFVDGGRVYLDGKLVSNSTDGLTDNDLGGALKAGTTHVLAVEVSGGKSELVGARGPAWISYHPEPASRLDLAGAWDISVDNLHYAAGHLPGVFKGTAARRMVRINAPQTPQNVVVHALGDGRCLRGLIINGRFVTEFHHWLTPEQNLNITPWVKFGQDNELILLGGGNGTVKEVSIEFHDKGSYP